MAQQPVETQIAALIARYAPDVGAWLRALFPCDKTCHRGWVSQMFFDVGAHPPETDLSVYLTSAEPAAM